jgi:hypothetical protein
MTSSGVVRFQRMTFQVASEPKTDSVGEFREVARNKGAKPGARAYLDLVFQRAVCYTAYSK